MLVISKVMYSIQLRYKYVKKKEINRLLNKEISNI